jgi:hypothetical protein
MVILIFSRASGKLRFADPDDFFPDPTFQNCGWEFMASYKLPLDF